MGSLAHDPIPAFHVLDDPQADNTSLPAFMVSTTRGFLPRMHPIAVLPSDFDVLESLLQRMPIKTLSGEPGLLARGKLGEAVVAELPDLTECVDKYKANLPLMNALYRDYSFLASAYLLEPCHLRFVKGEPYGLARDVLPANVARPLSRCAELCAFKPFMEYAGSYALFNYLPSHPHLPLTHPSQSLRLIRAFEHGLDPSSSEAGFILTHVEMASHSGALIQAALALLTPPPSREETNAALDALLAATRAINAVMDTMWTRSKPKSYTSFRTFIFGVKGQSGLFPKGVVYEGVGAEGEGVAYRGESGANDSMIPLLDNLVGVRMPETPLTGILREFRGYRPENHREFLAWVGERSVAVGLKGRVLGLGEGEGDAEVRRGRRLWMEVLDQIREFRWRHWCFAREYILKRTAHPTATGGSPIVTWLPNQLGAVLGEMEEVWGEVKRVEGGGDGGRDTVMEEMMELVGRQKEMLDKEVKKWCEERGVEV